MSTLFAVTRLELRRLAVRPMGWVLAALSLAMLAWRFVLLLGNFLDNQVKLAALPGGPGFTDLVGVPLLSSALTMAILPFGLVELAVLVMPLLTMSMLAGDRAQGTLPLMMSTGLSPTRIVLGKYLAIVCWMLVWLALTLLMPLSLAHGTTLDWGKFASATLGTVLALATLGAIGLACSAFASLPAMAAGASLMLGLALFTVNLAAQKAGIDSGVINWLAMSTHLEALMRGLVSSADLLWFVVAIVVALALAVRRVSTDRERG